MSTKRTSRTSIAIQVDTSDLIALARDVEDATGVITIGAARGLNAVAERTRETSVRQVVSQVHLTEQYVDPRVELRDADRATPNDLRAVIRAPVRGTRLDRYSTTRQVTQSNVWTKAKFDAQFGGRWVSPRPGLPRMPWKERTGDPLRGIPAGQKPAGIFANVSRGKGGGVISGAFIVKFKAGKSADAGGPAVVLRKNGKITPAYGPSVDQVVKGVWRDIEQDVAEELQTTIAAEVAAEVDKALRK